MNKLIFWVVGGIHALGTRQPLIPALDSKIRFPKDDTCDSVFASVENIKPSDVAAVDVHSMMGIKSNGCGPHDIPNSRRPEIIRIVVCTSDRTKKGKVLPIRI